MTVAAIFFSHSSPFFPLLFCFTFLSPPPILGFSGFTALLLYHVGGHDAWYGALGLSGIFFLLIVVSCHVFYFLAFPCWMSHLLLYSFGWMIKKKNHPSKSDDCFTLGWLSACCWRPSTSWSYLSTSWLPCHLFDLHSFHIWVGGGVGKRWVSSMSWRKWLCAVLQCFIW